jgi:DNA-binding GntR family transcriptional regulator
MSIKTQIYSGIRKAIITEKLSPGERLVESQLCKSFGASRGPVREALAQLGRDGFIELIPNKGALVTKLSLQDLKDYYALIALLESKAVEWAVPQLTQSDLALLSAINKDLSIIISGDSEESLEAWTRHNRLFHRLFWEKSGNSKLVEQIREIRQRILRYRYTSLMVPSYAAYLQDHVDIIEAARNKDAKKASDVMSRHISRALDVLIEFFSRLPGH